MKAIVLLDCDGVLADFLTPALAVATRVTGQVWTPESFKSWNIFDTIGKEHEDACYAEYEKPGFCANFKPYPGAQDAVRALQLLAEVHILTSPLHSPHWYHERVDWLADHFKVHRKLVHFSNRKELFRGDCFVDDKPAHVVDWAKAHPTGYSFLYAQPYNAEAEIPFVRLKTWTPLIELVHRLF